MNCKVADYIFDRWPSAVRENPADSDTLIGLPYPYIVPCAEGIFQELYYWDTYFACRGLALQGQAKLVLHNLLNFCYEIKRFGFIPNGNRTWYLNRSQPPFFGALSKLALELFPDDNDLKIEIVNALIRELDFWDKQRRDPIGNLYHYGSHADEKTIAEFFQVAVKRVGVDVDALPETRHDIGIFTLAEAESGWDFTSRFEHRCSDYAAIDLNALLWLDMQLLSQWDHENKDKWRNKADALKRSLYKHCLSPDGYFTDYDFKQKRQSMLFSCASLFPLWTGLATVEQAATTREAVCAKLEYSYGISTTQKINHLGKKLQWEYPNGWPCLQLITFEALARYGFISDARRIAKKYVDCVEKNFDATGRLWEKYNVVDGSTHVSAEYETPPMLGWSAGAYLVAQNFLCSNGMIMI